MAFKIIKQKKQQKEFSNREENDMSLVRILELDHTLFYQHKKNVAIDIISIDQNTAAEEKNQTDLDENFFKDIFEGDEVKKFKKIIAEELDGIINSDNQGNNLNQSLEPQSQPQVVDRRKRR